jgi:hypothetical protein
MTRDRCSIDAQEVQGRAGSAPIHFEIPGAIPWEACGMNILLWVLQVLLALAFFAHGCMFLFPPASVVEQMNAMLPRWFQLFLGIAEVLAAVGLTLPGIFRVRPGLVSWAAAGIMIVMIGATILHAVRGEVSATLITLALLAMATFVAYMRWRVAPITPRAVHAESVRSS